MKETQYSDSKTIKFPHGPGITKAEDWREIIGILLALLVIAAFLIIAFTMFISMAKDAGATSMVQQFNLLAG